MAAASTFASTAGEDPFAKIKGLIGDMIEKLMKEAEAEAAKKGYCDKEMSETETKKTDLETEIEGLSTKIEKMTADSKKLKGRGRDPSERVGRSRQVPSRNGQGA